MPLKPKLFDIGNPQFSTNGNVCIASLHVANKHHDFIKHLPYVISTTEFGEGSDTLHVWFDLRYNIEDAWLDLYEQLTIETSKVELDSVWDIELDDLPPETP